MVFIEDGRAGLTLGEDTEDRRAAGEDEWISRIAGGLDHHLHGVTILGEALRSPLDLPDAGEADDRIYLGYGSDQARGISEVADDWCHPCGSQLCEGVLSLRHSHDLMALLQQLSGDGAADESGCAGDENLHVPPFPQVKCAGYHASAGAGATQINFLFTNSSMPRLESSLPYPERLMPPKGKSGALIDG